ncbi:MAG: hypothetical protein ACRC14_04325 [Paracoccaceae bacterium]
MMRVLGLLVALFALSACAADNKWADDATVAQARFVAGGPPSITLFTVVGTRNGAGAHSGLLINGSERVMFDPAGTWHHPSLPERHDLHYGMTDRMISFYIDYHSRETYYVIEQKLVVTPQQAEMAIAQAKAYGAVPKAQCARSISTILQGVPGFEGTTSTWYPNVLAEEFGKRPGVTTRKITDDDADDNHGVLMVQANGEPLP